MDTNPAGGPRNGPPGNMTMRPPPSPGNGTMNPNVRPSFPNQRPPPQQQQQQQQHGGNPAGRAPITSPFQRQDPASGQQSVPMNPNVRSLQHQAPGNPSNPVRPPGAAPPQRPMQQQLHQQQQQQPGSQPPTPTGQHPPQFAGQGRPPVASFNNGSQTQLRVGQNSPQSQHSLAMRPPHMQPGQQPHVNGANIRPSASHPNLTGVPGGPPGNRMTPPSPSISATRSPQIRPLQQNQQTQGNGPSPQHHPPQQPPPQHQQPNLRPSASHPHLVQQAGIRPPPNQGSPVLAHQTAVRPPTPLMQHQPRPRPPQAGPHGQPPSQFNQVQGAPGQAVQLDMPSMNGGQPTNGAPSPQQRPHLQPQDMHQQQPQQRSPGARPILDQMRQQTQPSLPGQGAGSPQSTQHLNPAQRPLQRPTGPSQPQPRQQQGPGLVPLSPHRPPTKEVHASSPPAHGHDGQPMDANPTQGEHGRVPNASPQQHNTHAPNQRPANPQVAPGARPHPQQGPPGPAGFSGPHHPPRPLQAPGSPAQRPLGSAEIKLPGPSPNMASRPPPATQQHQQPQALQAPVALVEPEAPLSDSEGAYDEEDDIEGGGTRSTPPKSPAAQNVAPPQAKPAGGGPPHGPPRGPPKVEGHGVRKLSGAAGSGPVHIMQPSNNPTSPPASAFPALGQPKPRVRPPPGNANITPYRPPERPSQAPVMYSQSGQPATFSQTFPAQEDKDSTPAKSLVPQGADATSSSIRPREGGLQKRVVASDSNATKSNIPGSQLQPPPSPKLHGFKGPAILSVSNHRTSSSSKVKSLKTWMIRGGLVYLGYTAVFNCPPETTGVKGLYCKTTNGIGGLVKPFVAPHYNAHVGPHVDRYIAPVARQGHRIYVKVADPVVQGVFSAANTVYRSTAKKHVDSAKDQVISILPYPFKPKSKAADKETEVVPSETEQDKPHFDKISRQPVHVQEPAHASESTEETVVHDEGSVEDKVEDIVVEHAPEAIVEEATPIVEEVQKVAEEVTVSHEEPVVVSEENLKEVEEIKQDEVTGNEEDINAVEVDEQEPAKNEASEGSIYDKMAALKASLKGLREDVKEPEQHEQQQQQQSEEALEANVLESTETQIPADAVTEDTTFPVVEKESVEPTAESTIEFADKPTVLVEESEPSLVETTEAIVETPAVVLEGAAVPKEATLPEETVIPESVESPAAEEEIREALPEVTEPVVDNAGVPESTQSQEPTEQLPESEKVEGESVSAEAEVKAEAEGVEQEEKKAEVKEEGETIFEQQAASVSSSSSLEEEVEGEAAGHNGHDEL
ncbi:MAG: hypothetical protein J3R72DRAFT_494441 [Linnemannia gamsii]|nr:MAG: hypothetical protein J3R72DRAFT_494441 [Linnemannia gamsii]